MTEPLVIWAGDLHINSTVALCCPEYEKDDGNFHTNSKLQNALWDEWCRSWKYIKQKAKGREIVTIIGGEIADEMIKHPSFQYITHNTDDIRQMAQETLEPMLNVTDSLIVLRGTEAHSGINANLDEGIAREIGSNFSRVSIVKDGKKFSHWYLKIYIGGRLFDLAHHVTMGNARRTERNAANQLSADLQMDYVRKWADNRQDRFELPDYALRGHVHRYADSGENWPIHSIICPAWQMMTSYTHRISASAQKPDIGLVIIEPAQKEVEVIRYVPKNQKPKHITGRSGRIDPRRSGKMELHRDSPG
jgi:hypothetical protein